MQKCKNAKMQKCKNAKMQIEHRSNLSVELKYFSYFSFISVRTTMPRTCQIEGCKKTAKLKSNSDPVKYFCKTSDDDHSNGKTGLTFTKLVNSPCQTCVSLDAEDIKEATYGPMINGKLKRVFCKKHVTIDSITPIASKVAKVRQCAFEGCQLQPSFCLPGETKRKFCKIHKPANTISKVVATNRTCLYESEDGQRCTISPLYGFAEDQKAKYCKAHRLNGMRNIIETKRGCEVEGCPIIRAVFGLPGDKKATRCKNHKTESMVDVVTQKCNGCGLYVVNGTATKLCSYCSPVTTRQRTKEGAIATLLQEHFPNHTFDNNQTFACDISCAIKKYRPDFSLDLGFYYMIIECDEDAHRQYDDWCERKRMYEISMGLGVPVVFIRYNPDQFIMGSMDRHQCYFEMRKAILIKTVNTYLKTVTPDTMERVFEKSTIIVHYLLYDNTECSYERIIGLVEENGELEEHVL